MSRSAKAKGRLGQQEIRDKLLESFPHFEKMILSLVLWVIVVLIYNSLQQARKRLPLAIEVKRRKNELKTVYGYIEQAVKHNNGEPVVFYRSDHRPWVVMIGLEHYMDLLKDWKINGK